MVSTSVPAVADFPHSPRGSRVMAALALAITTWSTTPAVTQRAPFMAMGSAWHGAGLRGALGTLGLTGWTGRRCGRPRGPGRGRDRGHQEQAVDHGERHHEPD